MRPFPLRCQRLPRDLAPPRIADGDPWLTPRCAICGADDELLELVDTDRGSLWVCHDGEANADDWEEFGGIDGDD